MVIFFLPSRQGQTLQMTYMNIILETMDMFSCEVVEEPASRTWPSTRCITYSLLHSSGHWHFTYWLNPVDGTPRVSSISLMVNWWGSPLMVNWLSIIESSLEITSVEKNYLAKLVLWVHVEVNNRPHPWASRSSSTSSSLWATRNPLSITRWSMIGLASALTIFGGCFFFAADSFVGAAFIGFFWIGASMGASTILLPFLLEDLRRIDFSSFVSSPSSWLSSANS